MYFIIDKIDGYTEESIGNKYLTLISKIKNKEVLTKYRGLLNKIKNLIEKINGNPGDSEIILK